MSKQAVVKWFLLSILLLYFGCSNNKVRQIKEKAVTYNKTQNNVFKSKIEGLDLKFEHFINYSGKPESFDVVLIYPNNVCDICDKDIFNAIKAYKQKSFYASFTVFIPIRSYRDMMLYNQEYDLQIPHIQAYKNNIFDQDINLPRATFALIENNKVIAGFTPGKPINTGHLRQFLTGKSDD